MTIVKLQNDNGKWVTPWGHEFNTKKELEAFILGMNYISGSMNQHAEYLKEKVNFTENIK
jgi:hypothetical protein